MYGVSSRNDALVCPILTSSSGSPSFLSARSVSSSKVTEVTPSPAATIQSSKRRRSAFFQSFPNTGWCG